MCIYLHSTHVLIHTYNVNVLIIHITRVHVHHSARIRYLSHVRRMHACMYVCMYACMHVCMYACMHVCMYACIYVCMRLHFAIISLNVQDANEIAHRVRGAR